MHKTLSANTRIVTIVQARRGSTRLRDKIMLPLAGKELLIRVLERVKASPLSGIVVAAIPDTPEEDSLYRFCSQNSIEVFRGHPTDLLDRHYRAGIHYNADAVVKIPSDCPLIDPEIITKVIKHFLDKPMFDYVSNLHPATYPDGNDVEIFKMEALKSSAENANLQMEREHTTPYIWEHTESFKIENVYWETGLDYSMSERWTIDYPEDYLFVKEVYDRLFDTNPLFGLNDILHLVNTYPELKEVNRKYLGVNWYRNHLHELKTINAKQTRVVNGN